MPPLAQRQQPSWWFRDAGLGLCANNAAAVTCWGQGFEAQNCTGMVHCKSWWSPALSLASARLMSVWHLSPLEELTRATLPGPSGHVVESSS